jgi:hypothetical protein
MSVGARMVQTSAKMGHPIVVVRSDVGHPPGVRTAKPDVSSQLLNKDLTTEAK